VYCHVEYDNSRTVRIGLGFIKGLGEEEAAAIVAERERAGEFLSLSDFVRRVSLRPEAIENMIAVGAFDDFGLSRREALWQVGLFIPSRRFGAGSVRTRKPDRIQGVQMSLPLPVKQDEVTLPTTSAWERMAADYRVIGLSPHYHPLGLLRQKLPADSVSTRDLLSLPDGAVVRIGGLIVCRQRPGTAKGVTFLLLEDEYGLINVVVYRNLYEAQRPIVRGEPFVMIDGVVQREDRNLNLIASRFTRLESLIQRASSDSPDVKRIIQQVEEPSLGNQISPPSHNYR
jgi:error-prone DNA polymerase